MYTPRFARSLRSSPFNHDLRLPCMDTRIDDKAPLSSSCGFCSKPAKLSCSRRSKSELELSSLPLRPRALFRPETKDTSLTLSLFGSFTSFSSLLQQGMPTNSLEAPQTALQLRIPYSLLLARRASSPPSAGPKKFNHPPYPSPTHFFPIDSSPFWSSSLPPTRHHQNSAFAREDPRRRSSNLLLLLLVGTSDSLPSSASPQTHQPNPHPALSRSLKLPPNPSTAWEASNPRDRVRRLVRRFRAEPGRFLPQRRLAEDEMDGRDARKFGAAVF